MAAASKQPALMINCPHCKKRIDRWKYENHVLNHPTQIRPRVWLGTAANANSTRLLKKHMITHVVNCTQEVPCQPKIAACIKAFKRVPAKPGRKQSIARFITEANQFIDAALNESESNVVFIHCQKGVERSAAFLCAYLMWKEGLFFHDALREISSKRMMVVLNDRMCCDLRRYEADCSARLEKKNTFRAFGLIGISQSEYIDFEQVNCKAADIANDAVCDLDEKYLGWF